VQCSAKSAKFCRDSFIRTNLSVVYSSFLTTAELFVCVQGELRKNFMKLITNRERKKKTREGSLIRSFCLKSRDKKTTAWVAGNLSLVYQGRATSHQHKLLMLSLADCRRQTPDSRCPLAYEGWSAWHTCVKQYLPIVAAALTSISAYVSETAPSLDKIMWPSLIPGPDSLGAGPVALFSLTYRHISFVVIHLFMYL